MKLYIDTTNRDKIIIGVDGEKFETGAKEEKSQKLLIFIDEILRKKGKTIQDVKEIEVNPGPGSFTGIRVGVAVANSLGWALKIPVNGSLGGVREIDYNL